MRLWAASMIAVLVWGCPDYGRRNPPDASISLPDGSIPELPSPFPGSGKGSGRLRDPGMGVLFLVRLDRAMVNLVNPYGDLIHDVVSGFDAAGFAVTAAAVGSIYDGGLFWEPLVGGAVHGMLQVRAERAPLSAPLVCSTSPLAALARELSHQTVAYPPAYDNPVHPFATKLAALAVVVIDHGDRRYAHDAPECRLAQLTPAAHLGGGEMAQWLNVPTGTFNLPRLHTRFWFITTDEQVSFAAERERCAGVTTFPRSGLDAVSPSAAAFHGPLVDALNVHQRGLATRSHLCDLVGAAPVGQARRFATDWIADLKAAQKP